MRRTYAVMAMVVALVFSSMAVAFADAGTPSTNDTNRANGWSHFNVLQTDIGQVEIEFNQPRSFAACFEYRIDGADTTDERNNFNPEITDGLWPFVCLGSAYDLQTTNLTFEASRTVEIRLVFGAERSERFDWTSVDVDVAPSALWDDADVLDEDSATVTVIDPFEADVSATIEVDANATTINENDELLVTTTVENTGNVPLDSWKIGLEVSNVNSLDDLTLVSGGVDLLSGPGNVQVELDSEYDILWILGGPEDTLEIDAIDTQEFILTFANEGIYTGTGYVVDTGTSTTNPAKS